MRNALLAGGFIALACGVCGWFVVLRGQLFAGDALSHVAFPGALAAAAAGIDERIGLFAATIAAGVAIALLGSRGAGRPRRPRCRRRAGRRCRHRRAVHGRARARRVLPDPFQPRLGRERRHPGGAHAVRFDLRSRRRRSRACRDPRRRRAGGAGGDRAPAAVRVGRSRAGRRAGRADAAALGRFHGAARRGGRGGDPGGRGAAAAGPAGRARGSRSAAARGHRCRRRARCQRSRSRRCGAGSCSPTWCPRCRRAPR